MWVIPYSQLTRVRKVDIKAREEPYTTASAFFEAIWDAGVRYCFVNLGSDHPAILNAIVHGQRHNPERFPQIITCPHEMVAMSMADGYARRTNQPQCVIVHVDVGTQALGPAFHNAASGRAPVLVLAGATPFTQEGELKGSRSEFINWYQDVPDQRAIVAQYCRHAAEIRTGRNVKQVVLRALQFAKSEPQGPVYLMAAREVLEEEVPRVDVVPEQWAPMTLGGLPDDDATMIIGALVGAEHPLIIAGFVGRNRESVLLLIALARIPHLRVYDSGMTEMTFPPTLPQCLTPTSGARKAIETADVILILDADVPWIPTNTRPDPSARIFHVDADPLKQRMQLFYIPATRRYLASSHTALEQLSSRLWESSRLQERVESLDHEARTSEFKEAHDAHRAAVAEKARAPPTPNAPTTIAYLCATLRAKLPSHTIWVSEAVTNHLAMAEQLAANVPGSFITKGGSGLGWNGGAALGVRLAAMDEYHGAALPTTSKLLDLDPRAPFICNITGDGSFLFAHPSAVAWVAAHYDLPVLTVVLNNGGWRAPRHSAALVSPDGPAARLGADPKGLGEMGIGFGERGEQPRYAGIAVEASAGWMVGERVETWEAVEGAIERGMKAVGEEGRGCVLDVWTQ